MRFKTNKAFFSHLCFIFHFYENSTRLRVLFLVSFLCNEALSHPLHPNKVAPFQSYHSSAFCLYKNTSCRPIPRMVGKGYFVATKAYLALSIRKSSVIADIVKKLKSLYHSSGGLFSLFVDSFLSLFSDGLYTQGYAHNGTKKGGDCSSPFCR